MPWRTATVTDARIRFVLAYHREVRSRRATMTELCERFGVSRKSGYKYLKRQRRDGWPGLADRSRAPLSGEHWIEPAVRQKILEVKEECNDFGAKKILADLRHSDPDRPWPSVSAIHHILKEGGWVLERPTRRHYPHPGMPPTFTASAPNEEWSTDFKGQFRTKDRRYSYPLTIADTFSRYVLGCESLTTPSFEQTWRVFVQIFRKYGLPLSIRSDNGTPFSSSAIQRLSRLSVRWLRLGIQPRLIQPGNPQQNGRHERMHLTLKEIACSPAAANARAQQKAFDKFQTHFNERRPHESLDQMRPADLYTRSPREYPSKLPQIEYAAGIEPRRVNSNGVIKWQRRELFLSEVLAGEIVGVQPIDDGLWLLLFGSLVLGYYSDRDHTLHTEKEA